MKIFITILLTQVLFLIETKAQTLAKEYFLYGLSQTKANDFKGAMESLNKAISLDSNYSSAYSMRGFLRLDLFKDTINALSDFNKAILSDSTNSSPYNDRGQIYLSKKDFTRALSDANKAIQLTPDTRPDYYFNRAKIMRYLAEYQKAIDDLNIALKMFPTPIWLEAYKDRAYIYEFIGDNDAALADFYKLLEANPDDINSYNHIGDIHLRQKKYALALTNFSKIIELDPKASFAYVKRGVSKYEMKDLSGACKDWQKALELGYPGAKEEIEKFCK
jgi:tetratricopeptide (TPR) repeat protein